MEYYKILWKKSAAKELKNIDKQIIPKIISTVESLSKNPLPFGVKKLSGAEFNYRIRVGHRRDVYKK